MRKILLSLSRSIYFLLPHPFDYIGKESSLRLLKHPLRKNNAASFHHMNDDDINFHRFSWLASCDIDDKNILDNAIKQIIHWANKHTKPLKKPHDEAIWSLEMTAQRLCYWCEYLYLIKSHTTAEDFRIVYRSIWRQYRYILFHYLYIVPYIKRPLLVLQLYVIALTLRDDKNSQSFVKLLQKYFADILFGDGMVKTRNAHDLIPYLSVFTVISVLLQQSGEPMVSSLISIFDRMTSALRLFVYRDKKLACFHGSQEGDYTRISALLDHCPSQATMPSRLPYSGYDRLNRGQLSLLVDTGSSDLTIGSYASAGALELTYKDKRIFVNCGNHNNSDDEWQRLAATTAAHNALTIDDFNSYSLEKSIFAWRNRSDYMTIKRQNGDEGEWLICEHNGFKKRSGHIHKRQLFIDNFGKMIRGCDSLYGGYKKAFAIIRFHLHPSCTPALAGGGDSVLIKSGNDAYRFDCTGYDMAIEPSIYVGDGEFHQTKQIIITCPIDHQDSFIHWEFSIL